MGMIPLSFFLSSPDMVVSGGQKRESQLVHVHWKIYAFSAYILFAVVH